MIEPVPKVWHSEGSCLFRDGSRRKEKRKLEKRGGFRFLLPASPQKLASCQKKNGERVKRCFQENKQKEENIFKVEQFVRYLLCCRKYLTKNPPPPDPQNQLTDPSRGSKFFSSPLLRFFSSSVCVTPLTIKSLHNTTEWTWILVTFETFDQSDEETRPDQKIYLPTYLSTYLREHQF